MKKLLLMMMAAMMVCVVACKDEDAIGEAPEIESIELIPSYKERPHKGHPSGL